MKNLYVLFLIVLLTLFIPPLNAQMQIGPKAGLNIANAVGDDADFFGESLDSRTGFSGGIFFMYKFSNLFAIQPEAYYTMKGATLDISNVKVTFTLDYIEVPVLLKLFIPVEGSNVRPSIYAGPSIAFNTTSKLKAEENGQSEEIDLKDDTKSTEFSLAFGGGIGFMVGNNELGFDVRYILGLSSIDDTGSNDDVRNAVISFNVYFGFSLQ
jgi:hypothetical protein